MENKPLISIITVCYNAENNIKRTLKSILNQSFNDIEYIVIDGKSTDKTIDIVKEFTPNAVIISEKDNGIYDAMNKAFDIAKGEFICFINAGDALFSDKTLEKVSEIIKSNPLADIIYGHTIIIDEKDNELYLRKLTPPKNLTFKSFSNGMMICHQSFYVRKSIAPKYDIQYKFSADFDWCIKCIKASNLNVYANDILARYLNEGTTTKNHKASLKERFRIMSNYYGLIPTILRHLKFLICKNR